MIKKKSEKCEEKWRENVKIFSSPFLCKNLWEKIGENALLNINLFFLSLIFS